MGWKKLLKRPDVENPVDNKVKSPRSSVDKHKHEWSIISKTYGSPTRELLPNITQEDTVKAAMFGVTHFLLKCIVCNDFLKEELYGTDENRLDDEFDKVEAYGAQYVQRNGVTFIISRYQPPLSQGMVPLK